MKNLQILQHAISCEDINDVKRLIRAFLLSNITLQQGAIDPWKCVAKDKMRPVLNGIYFDAERKLAVATNGQVIFASPLLYDEQYAGKVIAKDGSEIEERFPKYQPFLLNEEDCVPANFVDDETAAMRLKWLKTDAQANNRKVNDYTINLSPETGEKGFWFSPKLAELLYRFGFSDYYVSRLAQVQNATFVFKKNENGEMLVVQPCLPPQSDNPVKYKYA